MRIVRTLLLGLLLVAVITFSIKNAENVAVSYFGMIDGFEIPLFLLILSSLLLGIFVGAMIDLFKRYQLKKAIQRAERIMEELQTEIRSVRSMSLRGEKDEGNL
ncbi:MAG: DUF1049 domain-containing protein [Proteobacteria bacterium]|nr:DUF1049 domain-containing protein [Pseudomonadota bacterium]